MNMMALLSLLLHWKLYIASHLLLVVTDTESQNHRMLWVERDFRTSVQTFNPLPWAGCPPPVQALDSVTLCRDGRPPRGGRG